MYAKAITLICSCLLLALGTVSAQQVTVRGSVTDNETGRRLDGVRVRLTQGSFVLSNSVRTGRNGTFELGLPAAGTYAIDLLRSGYSPGRAELVLDGMRPVIEIALEMSRLPGYEFDFLIRVPAAAEPGRQPTALLDTVAGVRVEVYDLTDGVSLQDSVLTGAGQSFDFSLGHRYAFLLRKAGYFAKRFDVLVDVEGCVLCFEGIGSQFEPELTESMTGNPTSQGAVLGEIPLRPITVGEQVVIPNIYYDFDKATIREDARPALDRLAMALRATPVAVTLGSHTDSRGSAEYNQSLSQRRAESAVRYLTQRGVDASRIKAVGYGESQLTNSCGDGVTCTEEEHQRNRRTTFEVTKLLQRSSFEARSLEQLIEEERATKRRAVEVLELTPE